MNITFLIGNGFDLALGLKTSYSDFIKHYLRIKDIDEDILAFKKSIKDNISLWSYAEKRFGKYTANYNPDSSLSFIKCYDDFCKELAEYIRNEESTFKQSKTAMDSKVCFLKSLLNFYNYLLPESKDAVEYLMYINRGNDFIYNFIDFNYTTILDDFLSIPNKTIGEIVCSNFRQKATVSSIIHIHGLVDNGLVFGVNDESQIENAPILSNRGLRRRIIKPKAIQSLRNGNEQKAKNYILNSNIICTFGMSVGETDKQWWEIIYKWMVKDSGRILVFFVHDAHYNSTLPGSYIDIEEKIQEKFFGYINGITEETCEALRNRIHIVVNANFFCDSKDPVSVV